MNRNEPALHSPATEVRVEKKIAFGHSLWVHMFLLIGAQKVAVPTRKSQNFRWVLVRPGVNVTTAVQ
jgi:hypothetical protein